MNDTVTKILELADDFAAATHNYFADQANVVAWEKMVSERQALQDELTRLFTPLSDEQISNVFRNASPGWLEETDTWSFKCGIKFAESRHGITGEKNEPA